MDHNEPAARSENRSRPRLQNFVWCMHQCRNLVKIFFQLLFVCTVLVQASSSFAWTGALGEDRAVTETGYMTDEQEKGD